MADSSSHPSLADHDGFCEAFYHMLWAKNFNNEPCPEVLVPDTIIYKYRIPAYWYFTGADGRLRRKNKASIVNQKIFKDFTAGARSDKDVVACHICERPIDGAEPVDGDEPAAQAETVIRYFDKASLKAFLFAQEKVDDGCLQKFVRPKGLFNSMIQAAWSPQMCLLERRVNVCPLLSGRGPLQERVCTYEGSEHLSRITPVRGTLLADRIQRLCLEMTSHIASTSYQHQKISRMLLNFKTDEEDNVWFLWCSSVRVVQSESVGDVLSDPALSPASSPTGARSGAGKEGGRASLSALLSGKPLLGSASELAPVCLNPAMSTPVHAPLPKSLRAMESVCPYTQQPLGKTNPYFLTYKTIVEYSHMLDARSKIRRAPNEVPPLLAAVCPELDGNRYAREMANPLSLFLYTRVLVSEEAYLDFSASAMPGTKVLPAITGKTRKKLLALSASAPVLPSIPGGDAPATDNRFLGRQMSTSKIALPG